SVTVTDFMPVASESDKARLLSPEHELIRRVRCDEGGAELLVCFDARPDYGRVRPDLRDAGTLGLRFEVGPRLFTLRSDVRLTLGTDGGAEAHFRLKAGEYADFSLTA